MVVAVISTCSCKSCKCNVNKSTGGRRGDGDARGKSQSGRGEGGRKGEGESGGTAEVDTNEEPL